MDLPRSDDLKRAVGRVVGFGKFIQRHGREAKNFENCICVSHLSPNLGKPAFIILSRENMRVRRPGDRAKNSKWENVGF